MTQETSLYSTQENVKCHNREEHTSFMPSLEEEHRPAERGQI
jgi:hypothetical protein